MSSPALAALFGLLSAAVFAIDVRTRLGANVPLLYIVPVLITLWHARRGALWAPAICTALVALRVMWFPSGDLLLGVVNRALTLLTKGPMAEKELVKKALALGQEMFLGDEIERREAVCKPLVLNALQAFVDHGYLVHREDYDLAPDHASETALSELERTIASYLPPVRSER